MDEKKLATLSTIYFMFVSVMVKHGFQRYFWSSGILLLPTFCNFGFQRVWKATGIGLNFKCHM